MVNVGDSTAVEIVNVNDAQNPPTSKRRLVLALESTDQLSSR